MSYMYQPGCDSGSYYGGNNSTQCYSEEYRRQQYGSNPGAGYVGQRPQHHFGHAAGYNSGIGSAWATETDKVTDYYETSGSRHGHGIGGIFGSRPHERKTHRRRRVVKQTTNGGFYSCSESDSSSDDEARRVC